MNAVLPGACVGVLGGGQLAQMLALDAQRMGYRVAICDPDPQCPAARVADVFVQGELDSPQASERLALHSDVITLDVEHVPAAVLALLETTKPVYPNSRTLSLLQDRWTQRQFLTSLNVSQPATASLSEASDFHHAALHVGFPSVLKTRRCGYDGRGQAVVRQPADLSDAWKAIGQLPAVLESHIDFDSEVSVLVARNHAGQLRYFPTARNVHRRGILHTTQVPAGLSEPLEQHARQITETIATALNYVGVMAVEFFVTRDEQRLVNEVAPRVHNSGHFSRGACVTSQFEQHLRAICGLPLADPSLLRPAVMLNLLGECWHNGPPRWSQLLSHPTAQLHLYGKAQPRSGRKMGHVLVVSERSEEALRTVEAIALELAPTQLLPPESPLAHPSLTCSIR